ncbi:MAG: caspase family protein [Devosia nanyangense]|uniref:Caspase family protein n=1 Tax=Devosia nanyangense TaxID=1228055 RepID=A0A933NYW3_9HYPH|nr:caspase family protein [Devosia nanyangense]
MAARSKLMHRMTLMLALAPVCFLGAMVATGAQARENYALIVAASDYPNLEEKYWLKGPKNDAELVSDYLINAAPVKFAPQNVVTLGSGAGLHLATHQAILDNLARIARTAKAGDFVFLQFSGHGSQQPATDASEADGRDEIFLAADTMKAPKGTPVMPNVVTDNEMADALKAIRRTGAFVWLVFDSCHSGTMTRGAPDDGDLVMRDIKPADLGIPDSAFPAPQTGGAADTNERAAPLSAEIYADDASDPEMGGLVAFFAAQSTETTPEKGYDVAQADGTTLKLNYGVFTYTIFSALAKTPNMTYRQLAQSVLADYASKNALKPTPLFEGKLDAPVFGSEDAASAEQWPTVVTGDGSITISAGQLHGLSRGTKLLLLPSPSASNDEAIGVMEVISNDQLRSKLAPSSDDTHPSIDKGAVPVGAYVRLAEISYPFELTVAKPDPSSTDAAEVAAVEAALAKILADPQKPMKLKVVEAGAPADVRLAVLSEDAIAKLGGAQGIEATSFDPAPKLWLLPATGQVSLTPQSRSPAMDLKESSFTADLSANLVTIFRATGLSRLSQANSFGAKDFKLSFGLQQAGSSVIAPMAAEQTPIIRSGDRLHVDFTNSSGKAVDINVLYIDHDYGITLICQAHLAANDRLLQPMADIADSDKGAERIVAVINESGKELTDLSFLTQRGIIVKTRGAGEAGLLGMLADLGAGEPTRGPTAIATRDTKTPRGAVVMVPVEALAPTGEQPAAEIAPEGDTPVGSCAG